MTRGTVSGFADRIMGTTQRAVVFALLAGCGTVTSESAAPDAFIREGDDIDARTEGLADASNMLPDNGNGDGGAPTVGMVPVPGGSYWQGCTVTDPEICGYGATPYHQVYLDDYWIDRTEVSQAAYAACVDTGDCPDVDGLNRESKAPVVNVTWPDALRFCQRRGARLPTEAEWERAARGTDTRLYPWGDQPASCEVIHGLCPNVIATYDVDTPAGASPVGALNMAGNVEEWVGDWYQESYYSHSAEEHNPRGPAVEPVQPGGARKVIRGGSIFDGSRTQRYWQAHYRTSAAPSTRSNYRGFRCAYSEAIP